MHDDGLIVKHQAITTQHFLRFLERQLDELPVFEKFGQSIYESITTDNRQPWSRGGQAAIQMQEFLGQPDLLNVIFRTKILCRPPNTRRIKSRSHGRRSNGFPSNSPRVCLKYWGMISIISSGVCGVRLPVKVFVRRPRFG